MKVDTGIWGAHAGVPAQARAIEEAGFDALVAAEIHSDPFLLLTLAAEHTSRVDLMTSIAVAFSRNPMILAQIGHDLNDYSRGRFVLGLGSQIRPHITKRFSMPWSKPAARMREFIEAMRAIWQCWHEGEPLNFRGNFYEHTLMTPMFTPPSKQFGAPRVFLAAVGPKMTEVAGEVADGLIAHGFTTPKYMREVTMPALEKGLEAAGRKRADFEVTCPVFTLIGDDEEVLAERRTAIKRQIAFYGSTPAYRPVLELHGWGDLQTELNRMSKAGQWAEMGELIEPEIFDAFAVTAEPKHAADEILASYGGLVDRLMWSGDVSDAETQREQLDKLRRG